MYKIYFYLMTIIWIFSVCMGFIDSSSFIDIVGVVTSLFALIGLFGFVNKKAIFTKKVWLYVLWADVLSCVIGFIYSAFFKQDPYPIFGMLFLLFVTIPLYYGLFKYYRNFSELDVLDKSSVHAGIKFLLWINFLFGLIFVPGIFFQFISEVQVKKIQVLYRDKHFIKAFNLADKYLTDYGVSAERD